MLVSRFGAQDLKCLVEIYRSIYGVGEAKRPKKVSKSASKIQITIEKVNLQHICCKFTTAARRGLRGNLNLN